MNDSHLSRISGLGKDSGCGVPTWSKPINCFLFPLVRFNGYKLSALKSKGHNWFPPHFDRCPEDLHNLRTIIINLAKNWDGLFTNQRKAGTLFDPQISCFVSGEHRPLQSVVTNNVDQKVASDNVELSQMPPHSHGPTCGGPPKFIHDYYLGNGCGLQSAPKMLCSKL